MQIIDWREVLLNPLSLVFFFSPVHTYSLPFFIDNFFKIFVTYDSNNPLLLS